MTLNFNIIFSRLALENVKNSSVKIVKRHEKWAVSVLAFLILICSVFYFCYPDDFYTDLFYHSDATTEYNEKIELPILNFEETKKTGFFAASRYRFADVTPSFAVDKNKKLFKHLNKSELEDRLLSVIPDRMRSKATDIIKPILYLSERYQIDPLWITSIIWTESHFDHSALSVKGAKGLMQLMPRTKLDVLGQMKNKKITLLSQFQGAYLQGLADRPFKTKYDLLKYRRKLENLEIGIYYLKQLYSSFGENVVLATVSYNMGPGWTRKRLNSKKSVGTRNIYLSKVKLCYSQLASQFGFYGLFTYQSKK